MNNIHQALSTLNSLIEKGMDFSDALFKATDKYNVCSDELTALYDDQYN